MECSGIIQAPHACDPGSTPGMRMLEVIKLVVAWMALMCAHTPLFYSNLGGPMVC